MNTMASGVTTLYLTFMFVGNMASSSSSVHPKRDFVSVEPNKTLILQCVYEGDVNPRQYWYKQSFGQKPRLISSFYSYNEKDAFYGEFRDDPRFTLVVTNRSSYLKITNLSMSDSATYFCVSSYLYTVRFSASITVSVTDLSTEAMLHQSTHKIIERGDSVTLSCTVNTRNCDGGHRVYWFRKPEGSLPGHIYTSGDMIQQCDTKTHTCVYRLTIKSPSSSDEGTYFCAVASCGHVLFGNGTKLNIRDDDVKFWKGASAFTIILCVLLALSICVMITTKSCRSPESVSELINPPQTDIKGHPPAGCLGFAAVSVNLTDSSRRLLDPTWSACVYYSVKQ
ncbi:uncharacterized protein LOC115395895 [Salarias fasciatus]|uniref:Uncharacterized LOC115395895 n=1 Tax=Salarias fasciatus TaxID=181472 RepID=A0A672GAM3_SALFA|nr:uncharacterized protein LOC115395895 [Salarias fasciatus]